ncbi:MotA/TolQ/ExbB proton channel family protein [Burkholderia multivorans]|uniref:MotA/TolQ/ExbB proton channel family protein n=1 Tax=Burkholderia multivorans TaxID=87883 RepID=UPI003D660EBB
MNGLATQFIVQGALWLLGIFSIVTWTLIVVKGIQAARATAGNRRYGSAFWAARSFASAAALTRTDSPLGRLAAVGFDTLADADESGAEDLEHSYSRHDLLERHLRQQIQSERRRAEAGLAVLASIGSTAPFVGLFGTVFGIIHALSAISHAQSASIAVVAGPIGEALVATGIGIAVAVPAVLGYNFYVRRVKGGAADLDAFATDFVTLAQKAGFRVPRTQGTVNQPLTEALA